MYDCRIYTVIVMSPDNYYSNCCFLSVCRRSFEYCLSNVRKQTVSPTRIDVLVGGYYYSKYSTTSRVINEIII